MLLFFLKDLTAIQFVSITAIGMFGFGFFNLVIWAFVTDVIDYHEYLTGLREDATVYSIYSMARKIGQAIAGGVGGIAIAAVGYNADICTSNRRGLKWYPWTGYLSTCCHLYSYFLNFSILISIEQTTYQPAFTGFS